MSGQNEKWKTRFGVELEGGVCEVETSRRVDLCKILGLNPNNNFQRQVGKAGTIGTDNGLNELEISTSPCRTVFELEEKLQECLAVVLRPEWEIHWCGQDPFVRNGALSACEWAPKPRYKAIRQVVASERPDLYTPANGPEMDWMSQYWAYQLHLEIDPSSEKANRLSSYLDNWGPHIARSAAEHLGQPGNRVEKSWIGWGHANRLPAYRWFDSPAARLHAWKRVPRVARKNSEGTWIPDRRRKLLQPGNPTDESFVWWSTRPRWSLGTEEFRWPDSLPPAAACVLTQWLLDFANEILLGWEPFRFSQEDWEGIRSSRASWLKFVVEHPELHISFFA